MAYEATPEQHEFVSEAKSALGFTGAIRLWQRDLEQTVAVANGFRGEIIFDPHSWQKRSIGTKRFIAHHEVAHLLKRDTEFATALQLSWVGAVMRWVWKTQRWRNVFAGAVLCRALSKTVSVFHEHRADRIASDHMHCRTCLQETAAQANDDWCHGWWTGYWTRTQLLAAADAKIGPLCMHHQKG